jgi:hypothetical protein
MEQEATSVNKPNKVNKSFMNYPFCINKHMIGICMIFVCSQCIFWGCVLLLAIPLATLTPKSCYYCAKNIRKNKDNYVLTKSPKAWNGELQCNYVNNDSKILEDYKKGIKKNPECIKALSISLPIDILLLICSVCIVICFTFAYCKGDYDEDGESRMLQSNYMTVSDILFGACWPFVVCGCGMTKGIPEICRCIEEEVTEYNTELGRSAV